MRIKYGFLLENFTRTNTLPVFRTESQCVPSHGLLVPFAYEAVEIVCYPPQ